jgi:hypothetical protein
MKKLFSISIAIGAMAFLSSCEKFSLIPDLDPVGGCTDLESYQIVSEVGRSNGVVREVALWVPIDEDRRDYENLKPEELKQVNTWVIIPDQNSNIMFEPCNLPQSFKRSGMRIVFEGTIMQERSNKPITGTSDFQLRGILDDEKPEC